MPQKDSDRRKLSNTEQRIIEILTTNNRITQKEIAAQIGLSEGGVRKAMMQLKKSGIIFHDGPTKGGKWVTN